MSERAGVRVNVPYHALDPKEQDFVLNGDGEFHGVSGLFAFLETKKGA